jgi:hypothetical protein
MGQAPVDLPDPLQAKPLADAGAADDLLSQIASQEIDRLLAEAREANDETADDEETADKEAAGTHPVADAKVPDKPSVVPAAPKIPEVERRETAVSSFVAEGDPALEAELDNLLASLNSEPVSPGDSGVVVPAGKQATAPSEGDAAGTAAPPSPSPAPDPLNQSSAPPQEQRTRDNAAEADPVVKGELVQVFDKMTASAEPATVIDTPTKSESAKPAGSIDLLKVLDPIIAEDAAKADEAAAAAEASTHDEEVTAEDRLPIYVLILEWVNAPLEWLPQPVRDAMGKIGILTLINAAAVLLYVLLFRRK